jgi:phenylalanyl-tRNA synthetase beta chain
MNISYKWLKNYVQTELSATDIAKILTSIGLEVGKVEKHETVKGGLQGLVVGRVLTCENHENSDHLHVTTVDVGENEPLQIVCGAPNVEVGHKVVVATIGTTLYSGDESFTIKRSKIRGVESFGMICAEDEIGLGTSHAGIMVLSAEAQAGMQAKQYFNIEDDQIIEVDITPNRSDAASHWGVARDLNAYFMAHNISAKLSRPSVADFSVDNEKLKIAVSVENSQACPRYAGVTLTELKVKKSPEWLQNKLLAIGLRPINNVVDVTNFVLHAFGQPLHAFDAAKISGEKIVVKNVVGGTKFTTLDGIERELSASDLMICNASEPMCIGGVFGGLNSGVTQSTTDIFLESAYFNPVSIRKTARYHGLNTDSSFRFERGIDPNDTIYTLKIAALLIKELAEGKISSQIVDIYPNKIEDFDVKISLPKICSLIGKNIEAEEVERIFKALEMDFSINNSITDSSVEKLYRLKVPAYRVDVQRDVDVIEDIMRIYGYNNVEISEQLKSNIACSQKPDDCKLQNTIAEQLTASSFYEIMNNSLTKSSYYENLTTYLKEHNVKIMNALSNDLNVLRQTLLFGGLESILYNANRQNGNLKFYEFGNCYQYIPQNNDNQDILKAYNENYYLALWLTGKRLPQSWLRKEEDVTIYDLKAYMQNIFLRLGINTRNLSLVEFSSEIFTQGLEYFTSCRQSLAKIGVVSKDILKHFDIDNDVYFGDIQWSIALKESVGGQIGFEEISKFPEVKRDLALLLDKKVTFSQIEQIARKTERKLLQSITLFDVYEGKNLEEGKKSYAISFVLQDKNKTLTDNQIDNVINSLVKNFERELGAKLR